MIRQVSHFLQDCPVCGRSVEVRFDYLGHLVTCGHCRGRFVASDRKRPQAPSVPAALLVEYRDEVFARLAADLTAAGVRVIRALSAANTLRRYAFRPPELIVVNVDRVDECSWLLTRKLRLIHAEARIWVYTSWSSSVDVTLANFVRADELIYYQGDLLRLSEEILERLPGLSELSAARTNDMRGTAAAAARNGSSLRRSAS